MRKDLEMYMYNMAYQVKKMNEVVDKANKQIADGILKTEEAEQLFQMTNVITQNYQRVVYCVYLLNKKPKWLETILNKIAKKKLPNFKEQKADRESVAQENEDALSSMKDIISEDTNG